MDGRNGRIVYVLRSLRDQTRYHVGVTSDVAGRLIDHNSGRSPQTARHGPWRLVVCLSFASDRGAAGFEKYLKSGSGRTLVQQHFI